MAVKSSKAEGCKRFPCDALPPCFSFPFSLLQLASHLSSSTTAFQYQYSTIFVRDPLLLVFLPPQKGQEGMAGRKPKKSCFDGFHHLSSGMTFLPHLLQYFFRVRGDEKWRRKNGMMWWCWTKKMPLKWEGELGKKEGETKI